jgi:hypothetical protein
MAKAKGKKGSVKVQDMDAKKNPKGGATTEYFKMTMKEVLVTSAAGQKFSPLNSTVKLDSSALKIK